MKTEKMNEKMAIECKKCNRRQIFLTKVSETEHGYDYVCECKHCGDKFGMFIQKSEGYQDYLNSPLDPRD